MQPSPPLDTTAVPLCYLCGAEGDVLFAGVTDRLFGAPGVWSLRRCGRCQLVWLDPVPAEGALEQVQEGYYTHVESPEQAPAPPTSSLRAALRREILGRRLGYVMGESEAGGDGARGSLRVRALAQLPLVRELIEGEAGFVAAVRGGRLLDVGCGNGEFLLGMRALGWSVRGVEPDPVAGPIARSRLGGAVHVCALEDAGLEAASQDVITMSHVIEHLPDPLATLRECRRLLRPGGRLVVTTPNVRSLGRRRFGQTWLHWDPPRHRFLFTPASLRACLARAGLTVTELRTPSRAARWTWAASGALLRGDTIPGWSQSAADQNSPGTLAFAALEHLATFLAPVGEELLAIAVAD